MSKSIAERALRLRELFEAIPCAEVEKEANEILIWLQVKASDQEHATFMDAFDKGSLVRGIPAI